MNYFVKAKTLVVGESGNLQIPLANGNVMKIPLSSVNITEEVNKTGKYKKMSMDHNKSYSLSFWNILLQIWHDFLCVIQEFGNKLTTSTRRTHQQNWNQPILKSTFIIFLHKLSIHYFAYCVRKVFFENHIQKVNK